MHKYTSMFKAMWKDQQGWIFFAYGGRGHGWKQMAFKYPDELQEFLKQADKQGEWTNVYFCPHLFKSNENKKKENASKVSVLWVDQDSGSYEDIHPKPTVCWVTSEGKHHALWILDKPHDPQEAEKVVKHLTYKTPGADKGCWNLGRVLRFPGSLNYKYDPPFKGEILWDDGPEYSLDALKPDIGTELQESLNLVLDERIPPMPRPSYIPSALMSLGKYGNRIPKIAWDILGREPKPDDDYSTELWQLERVLLESGIPFLNVFAIVRESQWNKYRRDNRPESHLWTEVYKASLEKGPLQDDPENLPWTALDELMIYSEKPEWLVEDVWMQKNVGWIAGVGKSYKSVISTDLALSIASGTPFLGEFEVKDPGPVLMIQEEDPVWRVAHRMQVICQRKGINTMQINGKDQSLVFRVTDTQVPLFVSIGGGLSFNNPNRMEAVERALDKYRPKMLILDPLFMMTAGMDDFKASDISQALIKIKEWRNQYGCAIAIVHHYRKGSGSSVEKLYGSQALYAWSENNLFVSREEDTNKVLVERDVKDAKRVDEKLRIEFLDIEDKYLFNVERDKGGIGLKTIGIPTQDMLKLVLSQGTENDTFSVKTLSQASGYTERTVRAKLKDLDEKGYVEILYEGPGKRVEARPLQKLLDEVKNSNKKEATEGGLLFEDF